MVFSQIYKIDIRPLTIYCKRIVCWKQNALMFAVASLEECFAELTSGSSVLKVLLTSLLLRSQEISSFGSQCYIFHPLGKQMSECLLERRDFHFPMSCVFLFLLMGVISCLVCFPTSGTLHLLFPFSAYRVASSPPSLI